MKKYLFGLFAIILAIYFSSFTIPSKKLAAADFMFDENIGSRYIQSDVQDVLDWVEAGSIHCAGGDEVACRIGGVSELYWHISGGAKILNRTAQEGDGGDAAMSITAAAFHISGTTGTYYVSNASSFTVIENTTR
jgi:hypothetical protein